MTNGWELNLTNITMEGMNPTVRNRITQEDILAWCGAGDQQALNVAIGGFVLALLAIIYFGGIRGKGLRQWMIGKGWLKVVSIIDAFLLSMIAFCFAIIIMRLVRGGM